MVGTAVLNEVLLERLLRQVECDAHRRGWDDPSQRLLFVVYDREDRGTDLVYREACPGVGPLTTIVGPYVARPLTYPEMLGERPVHAVFRMATNLTADDHPLTKKLLRTWRQPGYLGVGFLSEGWQQSGSEEDMEKFRAEHGRGASYADMPTSKEIRMALFVGGSGTEVIVLRVRGEKPMYYATGVDADGPLDGAGNQALRLIHAVITGGPRPLLTVEPHAWDPAAQIPVPGDL